MTTKQLVQRLSAVDGDLPIVIRIDLHGRYQGLLSFDDGGGLESFALLSSTTHLKEEDVAVVRRSESMLDRQLEIRTSVGDPEKGKLKE